MTELNLHMKKSGNFILPGKRQPCIRLHIRQDSACSSVQKDNNMASVFETPAPFQKMSDTFFKFIFQIL